MCNQTSFEATGLAPWSVTHILLIAFLIYMPAPAWAGDYTIYDREWRTKYHIRDGEVYDKNWGRKGYIREAPGSVPRNTIRDPNSGDRRILDRNYRVKGYYKKRSSRK